MSAGMYLLAALLVGIGGGLGSIARWGLRELGKRLAAARASNWQGIILPGATFAANVLACFLLGIVVAQIGSAGGGGELAYLMLSVGFCGGLSTMSTAAFDIVDLVRHRTFSLALGYLMLSIGAGMGALWLGLVIA